MFYTFSFSKVARIGILLLSIAMISSCSKKDDKSSGPYYTLNKEGLAYIQIPLGKYFIYKDSATNRLDSMVVTQSKLEVLYTSSSYITGASSYDAYNLTLSNRTAGIDTVWLKGSAIAAYSNTNFTLLSYSRNLYDEYMFRFPDGQGSIFPNDRMMSTMTVEGKTYNQVILTTGTYITHSKFYWAKGIGLIRYERGGTSPRTFTLVKNGQLNCSKGYLWMLKI